MIRDQRTMLGARRLSTPADVRAFWQAYASRLGVPLVPQDTAVVAYVNESRWVADCPACNGGMAAWPENAQACCLDCGGVYTLTFPPASDIAKAAAVLEARPTAARNWRPEREKIAALVAENLARGVPVPKGVS